MSMKKHYLAVAKKELVAMTKDKQKQKKNDKQKSNKKHYPMPKNFFGDSQTQWVGRKIDREGGIDGKKLG